MLSRFHLIPERNGQADRRTDGRTDRQTDRHTDGFAISISRVSMLTRDKNCRCSGRDYKLEHLQSSWLTYVPILSFKKYSKICLFVLTWSTNVTDRRTDRQTDTAWQQRPRLCIASRVKKRHFYIPRPSFFCFPWGRPCDNHAKRCMN